MKPTTFRPRRAHGTQSALALALALIAPLSGCGGAPTKPVAAPVAVPAQAPAADPIRVTRCTTPVTRNVEEAFAQARRTLSERACQYEFDAIEAKLLEIATSDPGEANQRRFAEFYRWTTGQGVITKLQAKQRYSAYFTPSYAASLPDDLGTCGLDRDKDRVMKALAAEVKRKELGLMRVLGERDAWFRAKRDHDHLVYLIEGTLNACRAGA